MRLFVDTSAWFALNSRRDQFHRRSLSLARRFRIEPVALYLTDYILDETVTLLRLKVSHSQAVAFLDLVKKSPQVVLGHVSPEMLESAEKLFRRHRDKRWSFTDCVSFVYMDKLGLEEAFSFDDNFQQYGKRMAP